MALYEEDARIVGLVQEIQDQELEILKKVSRTYYRFISLPGSPLAKSLPANRRFAQAIKLEPGKTASWGPNYSRSQKELEIL